MSCDQYCHVWWGTWWPWAEANQGMLSVAALMLTATLALMEFRRANKAEALARQIAESAEAAEERRANEAIEREARLAREAQAQRREDEINSELLRIGEYATAVRTMIRDAELGLQEDHDRAQGIIRDASPSSVLVSGAGGGRVRTAAEGLQAIAHAAPLDPQLILITRKAMLTLGDLADYRAGMSPDGVARWYGEQVERLASIRQELTEQEIALANRIRTPPIATIDMSALQDRQF